MARRYREWLDRSGWSDAALARKLTDEGLDTTRAACNAWRNGRSRPSLDRLAALGRLSDGEITAAAFTDEEAPCQST